MDHQTFTFMFIDIACLFFIFSPRGVILSTTMLIAYSIGFSMSVGTLPTRSFRAVWPMRDIRSTDRSPRTHILHVFLHLSPLTEHRDTEVATEPYGCLQLRPSWSGKRIPRCTMVLFVIFGFRHSYSAGDHPYRRSTPILTFPSAQRKYEQPNSGEQDIQST
jgi:hypothetical protein